MIKSIYEIFLCYVDNVDEPDDKYSQEKTVQKIFVTQIVDPAIPVLRYDCIPLYRQHNF